MKRCFIRLAAALLMVSCFMPLAVMEVETSLPTADNAGTTDEIDISTDLEDGIYIPDAFAWNGGTGRLKGMECTQISVRDGMTYATIVLYSGKYSYLKANGGVYPCTMTSSTSTAEIPVRLNVSNQILGCTLAMTAPHEVGYSIRIDLDSAKSGSDNFVTVGGIAFEADPEASTQILKIYHFEDMDLINIEDAGYYFICNDAEDIPSAMSSEAQVIVRPAANAYIADAELAAHMINEGAAGIGMISENTADNGILKELIEADRIQIVGRIEELDYKALVIGGCDLAIAANTDVDDETAAYFDMLGIPLFRDRSAEEMNAEDAAKWAAVYHLILDFEEDVG